MENNIEPTKSDLFVTRTIERVRNDSACRAALRRATNPNTESYAWEYLLPFCNLENTKERLAYGLVGAAIAQITPEHDGKLNIGKALRVCCEQGSSEDAEKTRLRRLLACNSVEDLTYNLRRVVKYLQSKGATLSYKQLLVDIVYWNKRTKIRWTKDFFNTSEKKEKGAK